MTGQVVAGDHVPGDHVTGDHVTGDHVTIEVYQEGELRGYRVLDLGCEYGPLTMELGSRAVGARPHLKGCPWRLELGVERFAGEAYLAARCWPLDGHPGPLSSLEIPLQNLAWLAREVAVGLGVDGAYSFGARVLAAESPVVQEWYESSSVEDGFDLVFEDDPRLTLPSDFEVGPPPGGFRSLDPGSGGWAQTVFERALYDRVVEAARAEEAERGWLLQGRVHLDGAEAYVVVERLVDTPVAEAGPEHLVARGVDILRTFNRHAGIVGFLHLHPRRVDEEPVGLTPSAPDTTVAWNVQATSGLPVSFPIAHYGRPRPGDGETAMACFTYHLGLLSHGGLAVAS